MNNQFSDIDVQLVKRTAMEILYREPTNVTPLISFNPESGDFIIQGRSIPENAEMFYSSILGWLDCLCQDPPLKIVLTVELEFLNIASSKRLLFVLYRLLEARSKGCRVMVRWCYDRRDEDMLEVGKDYSQMVSDIPFEFLVYDAIQLHPNRKVS
ncbi:MAG: DUF1987 domain-containing protein [Cryomorphaceae bacterium]|nr:MAG: DUF1987 domain-containing protein [Cryomorphaceae bacterium]